MSLAAQVAAFRDKAVRKVDAVVRETTLDAAARVIELSPIGDPLLWAKAPAAGYVPGHFVSNWFLSIDAHVSTTADQTNVREVNGLDSLPEHLAGHRMFIQNSLPYAQALEYGHSGQAPAGIIAVIAPELADIAYRAAQRVAG